MDDIFNISLYFNIYSIYKLPGYHFYKDAGNRKSLICKAFCQILFTSLKDCILFHLYVKDIIRKDGCKHASQCSNIKGSVTEITYGVISYLDFSFSSVYFVINNILVKMA